MVKKRRWCPSCSSFGIAPGQERCRCGAKPSSLYPGWVEVDDPGCGRVRQPERRRPFVGGYMGGRSE